MKLLLKEEKNIRYFLVLIFVVFNSFSVSTSTIAIKKESEKSEKIKSSSDPGSLNKYPESVTKTVSLKLDSLLKRYNRRFGFHGNILVAKNGKMIFEGAYGYADFRKKEKLSNQSVFQLASVSKQFTAASVLQLYEKGLLELDDHVTRFFPEFPYEAITIRQLLNHTSGLPKYFWLAETKWDKSYPPSNSEMMQMFTEYKVPLFFKPGSRFDYSNTGYFVLASIVEKISGMTYGDYLSKNIFKPLKMDHSFVYRYTMDPEGEGQLSGYRLYRRYHHLKITGTVNDAIVGDKNVYSTSEDLFKWINGLNSGKVISKESLAMMYTKGKTKYGREIPYGFGFRISDKQPEKLIYHNGKWNGFSTSVKQYVNSDLLIITLEHTNYHYIGDLNKKIKKIIEEDFDPGV